MMMNQRLGGFRTKIGFRYHKKMNRTRVFDAMHWFLRSMCQSVNWIYVLGFEKMIKIGLSLKRDIFNYGLCLLDCLMETN